MELKSVAIDDFDDLVDVGIFVAFVVVEVEDIDPGLRSAPVDVEGSHFIEGKFGEVGGGID
jgi:hypothetical protein